MFSLKKLQSYNQRPICKDISSNENLYFKDILDLKKKLSIIIKKKSLIFLIYSNNIDFVSIYLSLLNLNSVPIILNERIHKTFIKKLIKKYKPKLIFYPLKFQYEKKKVKFSKYYGYKIFKNSSYKIDKNIALLVSTSGSTGSIKNVVCSYKNIFYVSKSISSYLKIKRNDRPVLTLPLSYVYGLSVLNSHLYKNATINLISENFLNRNFWKLISNNKITTFPMVPYQLEILDKIKFDKFNLSSIKYLTVAGGKTPINLLKKIYKIIEKKKIKLFCMYGQAEATSRISFLHPKFLPMKIGSIGKAIPGGKIFLYDKNNHQIYKTFSKGEIVYKGKNIMMGYSNSYKDLERFPDKITKLYTGDLGYKDEENFFYVTGRQTRDMKIFGNRINLDEIENILSKFGYNCKCIGGKNLLKVFHNRKKNINKVPKILSNLLGINSAYMKIFYLREFPLGHNNKIDYIALSKIK